MDAPGIAAKEHRAALRGLARLNRVSGVARRYLPYVLEVARETGRRKLRVLDVACGGGDVPWELARRARERGVELELVLADKSGTALEQARRRAEGNDGMGGFKAAVETLQCAALDERLPEADIVMSSLFLHHLDQGDVVAVLRHLAARARQRLLVSDLRRSRVGLEVARVMCRVCARSPVVWHDGPASVRGAWTMGEMRAMAREAGLETADVRRCWPWRMMLSWRRHHEDAKNTRTHSAAEPQPKPCHHEDAKFTKTHEEHFSGSCAIARGMGAYARRQHG